MMKHFSKIAILATVCCLHISCSSTSAKAQTFQQHSAAEKQAYVEEKDTLGKHFQGEGVSYTPALVAAAIIGEHPQDFGIDMRPLSMLPSSQ